MSREFAFAVIADTHIRPEPLDVQSSYPSDRLQNDRNRHVIDLLCQAKPDFVIHLGDVVHTVPCLAAHGEVLRFAKNLYERLPCPIHVTPGNHDVGDKEDSQAAAPKVGAHSHEAFASVWGDCWQSIDHEGCRFILLDGCLLGSGLARESDMRSFVEKALRDADRAFLFLHYPPFILDRREPSHYDNVAPEPRSWLLEQAEQHNTEAIFAGHAHTFFFNRIGQTDLYCLPSTAFTRPEYSELFPVEPAPENGRNDAGKLGFFLVHVRENGHSIEMIRSESTREVSAATQGAKPPGVWLRGGGARQVSLPQGDLDPFATKRARNDHVLLSLWEMGIREVRMPLANLADPATASRIEELGIRFPHILAASVGLPTSDHHELVAMWADRLSAWEIILPESDLANVEPLIGNAPVPIVLSWLPVDEPDEEGYFSHFPATGFTPDSPALESLPAMPSSVSRIAFRACSEELGPAYVRRILRESADRGLQPICHVELPRNTEADPHVDDEAVLDLVRRVLALASEHPTVSFFLDTFEDKDRGYFPRHGLVDRRGNPRPAGRELTHRKRLLAFPND